MKLFAALALASLSLVSACPSAPVSLPVDIQPRPEDRHDVAPEVVPGADVDALPKEISGEPLPAGAVMRLGASGLAHAQEIHHVALSRDGKTAWSSAIYESSPMAWDTATGRSLGRMPPVGEGSVGALALSPDGETLAVAHDEAVALVNPTTGVERVRVAGKDIVAVVWSPDGALIAVGQREGRIALADPATGKIKKALRARDEMFDFLAFSPDGARLATSGGDEGAVYVWDTKSGKKLFRWSVVGNGYGHGIAWLPDGTLVVATGAKEVVRFAPGATQPSGTWPLASIASLAVSADGKLIIGTFDSRLAIYDAMTGSVLKDLVGGQAAPSRNKSYANVLAVGGGRVVSGWESGLVRVFDLADGSEVVQLPGHRARVDAVAWSSDGRFVASGGEDGTTILWRTANGRVWRTLASRPDDGGAVGAVQDIAIHGMTVAVALANKQLEVWDAATGKIQKGLTLPAKPNAVAWSPSGKRLAIGFETGEAYVVDATTWEGVFKGDHGGKSILQLAFAASDDRLVVTLANTLVLWDVVAIKVMGDRTRKGMRSNMDALAVSPDGKVAVTGGYGGAIDRWDLSAASESEPAKSVAQIGEADGASNPVMALAALPDGGFVSGGSRGDLLVVGPDLAQRAHLVGHGGEVTDLSVSPDGKFVASASTDMSVLIWKL